jgi:hypothetical protein
MSMKNSNGMIGNRTRDLSACTGLNRRKNAVTLRSCTLNFLLHDDSGKVGYNVQFVYGLFEDAVNSRTPETTYKRTGE